MSAPEGHAATAAVCDLLDALRLQRGLLSTRELAERTGVHRDTVRRVLSELERRGWAVAQEIEGAQLWALGAALPRIGLDHLDFLNEQAQALRDRFAATCPPGRGAP